MEVKGANPFLFAEEEISPNSSNSNPFLMNEDDFGGDNPFLSQSATTMAPSSSTNPFAFDPMDMGPAEAQQMETSRFPDFDPAVQEFDSNTQGFNSSNIFSVQDFLSDTNIAITTTATPQKPTDLDLKYINSETASYKPPKETQDLLMSVMGAMDATSTHLLDKIPPTRTPSPVSMRDLHSPSPTPEPFGDLLDVSDAKEEEKPTNDLLMLDHSDDVNKNQAPQKPAPPQRPSPPTRPPRPALPPQKPPPPIFDQTNRQMPPQKPLPPNLHKEPATDEIMMFGETIPPKPVTTQDIMNLYNKPIEKQEVTDLLCDAFDAGPETGLENVQNDKTPQPLVQDNFLSPDPSQSETQMDTSDSQSKGSASSVTFNPFAVQDDIVTSPVKTNDVIFQEDVQMDEPPTPPHGENKEEVFAGKEETFVNPAHEQVLQENIFAASSISFQQTTTQSIYQKQDNKAFQNESAALQDKDIIQKQDHDIFQKSDDAFDAFAVKFESAAQDENKNGGFNAFSASSGTWGDTAGAFNDASTGFGPDESFDAFLAMNEPPAVPQSTPNRFDKSASMDSDEGKDFTVVIRPKNDNAFADAVLPTIAPPPAAVAVDTSPRFNPFDQSEQAQIALPQEQAVPFEDAAFKRTDSQETPPTPLFDDDVSQPLEPFPRLEYLEDSWEIQLRQPNKKKITGQRFWRKMWLRIYQTGDTYYLQLFNNKDEKNPVQELPLQPCYSVSDIGAQQYDTFGKIFTVKIQYIFYKERPGIRPGQVKKAERITNKLSQFAAYAIQGDYQGVKEFGSDLKKLGLPVEHSPQVSQLMKLGSLNYEDLKRFSVCLDEALFKMNAHRDRALQFKMEEVQITAVDELYVEQDAEGHIDKQIARVRLFFLGFLTGMPDIELGINDMRRQGKEVVGRHDIIPVATEEWIRLEDVEFHSCVQQDEYENSHIIKFQPPDACYIELMRFRIRPPKNRELPLQLKPAICILGNKVELRADVLVPGFASRKLGQVPCEDVMIRFPIPECWIYLFRVEKHFRYGSVKSTHRRTGKVKGIERILGTVDTLQESLIEVTSGQAKYEHQHRAIVWRCPRLPKEGQGAYTTHNMVCRLALTSYDQMPEKLAEYCYVEFTMPATQVSHTTVRSVSMQNSDSDDPPEKYVRYLARHEYRVGIEHMEGSGPGAYEVATTVTPKPTPATIPEQVPEAAESSTDSD